MLANDLEFWQQISTESESSLAPEHARDGPRYDVPVHDAADDGEHDTAAATAGHVAAADADDAVPNAIPAHATNASAAAAGIERPTAAKWVIGSATAE